VAGTGECGDERASYIKCGELLTGLEPVSFSRKTLLHRVSKKVRVGYMNVNPFQPSDAMWRHTFHLSLICMSFAQ
jgi:hypothetical protein